MNTKAKIITISSGNSGVGKTCTAVNLAVLLAQKGYKVCLFDADAKLENVNIMLNLIPDYTLQDVLSGDKTLHEITLQTAGLHVIPGITGLTSFISLSKEQQIRLQNSMLQLQAEYDYLIIDNTAGISNSVRYYTKVSNYVIIVITPDPDSLSAAFSLIRALQKRGNQRKYQIMVNNVSDETYARRIFKRFFAPIEEHIGCQINYFGCVMTDEMIPASICLQNPVVLEYPTSACAFSFSQLARRLVLFPEHSVVNQQHISQQKTQPEQLSDFSSNTVSSPVSTEQLKDKIISNINNEQVEDQKLKEMVLEINSAYAKRFGHSAVNLPDVIHDALKMDHLSEQTLRNLILTLYSFHQDQFGQKAVAENTISTSTSLTQDSVNLLIKLLQQENMSNMQIGLQQNSPPTNTTIPTIPKEQQTPQLVQVSKKPSPQLNELLETIRLASMVDS